MSEYWSGTYRNNRIYGSGHTTDGNGREVRGERMAKSEGLIYKRK